MRSTRAEPGASLRMKFCVTLFQGLRPSNYRKAATLPRISRKTKMSETKEHLLTICLPFLCPQSDGECARDRAISRIKAFVE